MDIRVNGVGFTPDGLAMVGFNVTQGMMGLNGNVPLPMEEYKKAFQDGSVEILVAKALGDAFHPTSKETGESGNLALLDAKREIRELRAKLEEHDQAIAEVASMVSSGEEAM